MNYAYAEVNSNAQSRSKEVETLFNDPKIKNEPFRENPITKCINIDSDKVSNLTYIVCLLSMLDAFSFALTFSIAYRLTFTKPYEWGYDKQLFAMSLAFGQPLNYF